MWKERRQNFYNLIAKKNKKGRKKKETDGIFGQERNDGSSWTVLLFYSSDFRNWLFFMCRLCIYFPLISLLLACFFPLLFSLYPVCAIIILFLFYFLHSKKKKRKKSVVLSSLDGRLLPFHTQKFRKLILSLYYFFFLLLRSGFVKCVYGRGWSYRQTPGVSRCSSSFFINHLHEQMFSSPANNTQLGHSTVIFKTKIHVRSIAVM